MTQGHTPGPWYAEVDQGSAALFIRSKQQELAVARVSDSVINGRDRANARLIATAPELLEFVQQIFNGVDTGMIRMDTPADETLENVMARGRQALVKATGAA